MIDSADHSKTAEILAESLRLRQPPVAVCFTESLPSGIAGHPDPVPAGCRFWEDAAAGAFGTSAPDHSLCAIGAYTHNFSPSAYQEADLNDVLEIFGELGYVRREDLSLIPVLKFRPKYIVYGPLAQSPLAPDVVILFVDPNQTLILCEAAHQVEHQNPPAMGRPACAVISQVMNTGRAALSLGCCGARAYLDMFTGDTAVFAIPGKSLTEYTQRIQVLATANATLSKFHQIRRRDIAAGKTPTVKDSLTALKQ